MATKPKAYTLTEEHREFCAIAPGKIDRFAPGFFLVVGRSRSAVTVQPCDEFGKAVSAETFELFPDEIRAVS